MTDSVTKFETCHTFRVPTFAVSAKTFVVVSAFETDNVPSATYETFEVDPATPDDTRYTMSPGFPVGAGPMGPVGPGGPGGPPIEKTVPRLEPKFVKLISTIRRGICFLCINIMALIGDFTGGTLSADTVTVNTAATLDSFQIKSFSTVNGILTGIFNPSAAMATKYTIPFGVTLPSVPRIILTLQTTGTFLYTGVVSAVTTTGFTMYHYKDGATGGFTPDNINWLAIY